MRRLAASVFLASSWILGCGDDSASHRTGPSFEVPAGKPEDLPKIPADAGKIAEMLRARFGDDVSRNIEVEVKDEGGGARVRLRGEVPTAPIRDAVMNEVAVRVLGIKIQDFHLDVAGPIRRIWGFEAPVDDGTPVVFSPDLSLAFTRNGEIYETATGRRLNRLGLVPETSVGRLVGVGGVRAATFSPDGKTLATGHERNAIVLWEMPLATRHRVLQAPDPAPSSYGAVVALSFTGDGKGLAVLQRERGEIFLWDLEKGTARLVGTQLPNAGPHEGTAIGVMAVSPDGKTIASAVEEAREEGISLWDVASRTRSDVLKGDRFDPDVIAWSKDGRYLAAGRFEASEGRGVLVWEMPGKRVRTFPSRESERVDAIAFSDDGRTLATRHFSGPVQLWDLESGAAWLEIGRDQAGTGRGLRFSPDGAVLATQSNDIHPASIRLWDVSRRPGANGAPARLPPALPNVASRDDELAQEIENAIRTTFDRRNVESLQVEVLPDGSVRLRGKVSSVEVKDVAGRTAATQHTQYEGRTHPARKVINEIEVTGRYGK